MTILVVAALAAVLFWSWRTGSDGVRAGLGWYELFFLFVSSAFLGDLFETVFVFLRTGVLMSRSSLLYGPLSLVWGLGAVLMTLVLTPLARRGTPALFAGGVVLGGGFEYMASYSQMPFNLAGRTNLLFALFWGAAGVFWVRLAAPVLLGWLGRVPRRTGQALAMTAALLLTADMSLSAAALLRMEERTRGLTASNRVEQVLDTWYTDDLLAHRYRNMQLPGQTLVF